MPAISHAENSLGVVGWWLTEHQWQRGLLTKCSLSKHLWLPFEKHQQQDIQELFLQCSPVCVLATKWILEIFHRELSMFTFFLLTFKTNVHKFRCIYPLYYNRDFKIKLPPTVASDLYSYSNNAVTSKWKICIWTPVISDLEANITRNMV